ncbi:MAG: chorismate synthase [Patescibacteria group bacterium]|nr:chorismate synthase [Patescibacteria group bacterium]
MRFLTSGESHGPALTVTVEGLPAGIPISLDGIHAEMKKRMTGSGAGGRMLIETDEVRILSGIRFGKTIGSPVTLLIENRDYKNWGATMSASEQPDEVRAAARVTKPRPGHTDLAGVQKYAFDDVRNVLERASARETTARVAAGALFKQFLAALGIEIASHTIRIGHLSLKRRDYGFDDVKASYATDPETRCIDAALAQQMRDLIKDTRMRMDTLGGIVETWAVGVPVGLGSYVHFDRRLDGRIAQALMSIQSVKAVEIGDGILSAGLPGSEVHDEIIPDGSRGFDRNTNRAGGIEGGVTNGMPIIVRVYHKPISTLYKPMNTVDILSREPVKATVERSDICIVPRGGVVSEAMLAYVLSNALVEKFGGDVIGDIQASIRTYLARIR